MNPDEREADCDETDDEIHPGADERCNGIDDSCEGAVDEGVLGSGAECPGESCQAILDADASTGDGLYHLSRAAGETFQTLCDMTTDDGGWTFIGAVVNDGTRRWNTYDVWTDDTLFGLPDDHETTDVKSDAFFIVSGNDLLMRTAEYSYSYYDLLSDRDFARFVAEEYDGEECSTTILASGADWYDGITEAQSNALSFVVRPWDNNASCFPGGNENAIIGMQLATCCWTAGLGNTPRGYPAWQAHDLSLLRADRLRPEECEGEYPCNELGARFLSSGFCYDTSCKVHWAAMYVR